MSFLTDSLARSRSARTGVIFSLLIGTGTGVADVKLRADTQRQIEDMILLELNTLKDRQMVPLSRFLNGGKPSWEVSTDSLRAYLEIGLRNMRAKNDPFGVHRKRVPRILDELSRRGERSRIDDPIPPQDKIAGAADVDAFFPSAQLQAVGRDPRAVVPL